MLSIIFILGAASSLSFTFGSQYVGDIYVRTWCEESYPISERTCSITLYLPEGYTCKTVAKFDIPALILPKFLDNNPMKSCGWCTPRADCARIHYQYEESRAFNRVLRKLWDSEFRIISSYREPLLFSNGTTTVGVTTSNDTSEIYLELSEILASSGDFSELCSESDCPRKTKPFGWCFSSKFEDVDSLRF